MHIAIAGNIGSGKTTLTRLLCEHFKWTPRFEPVDHNPYLADFYEDMERWSFNLQIYFLNKRFRDVVEISRSSDVIVQDRTIYEDANIFAPNLHDMGLMSSRDFDNYQDLFSLMISLVKAPDLLIFLRSSVPSVVGKIQKRGREYESSIRIDYLTGLNDRYEKWISNYKDGKLLILDVDKYDFEENPADFSTVCDLIEAQLNGLFGFRIGKKQPAHTWPLGPDVRRCFASAVMLYSAAGASSAGASAAGASAAGASAFASAFASALGADLRLRRVAGFLVSFLVAASAASLKSTSSIIAISAASPSRKPVFTMRVYPPGRSAILGATTRNSSLTASFCLR